VPTAAVFPGAPGQTIRREELLREVWGITFASATRTLDVHVGALRQKIEDDPKRPRWIMTVHGIGYQFRE
jgi:two-component system alkaline phosphatase synthesis response regulator PhoP